MPPYDTGPDPPDAASPTSSLLGADNLWQSTLYGTTPVEPSPWSSYGTYNFQSTTTGLSDMLIDGFEQFAATAYSSTILTNSSVPARIKHRYLAKQAARRILDGPYGDAAAEGFHRYILDKGNELIRSGRRQAISTECVDPALLSRSTAEQPNFGSPGLLEEDYINQEFGTGFPTPRSNATSIPDHAGLFDDTRSTIHANRSPGPQGIQRSLATFEPSHRPVEERLLAAFGPQAGEQPLHDTSLNRFLELSHGDARQELAATRQRLLHEQTSQLQVSSGQTPQTSQQRRRKLPTSLATWFN